jgi:hypothetical protein
MKDSAGKINKEINLSNLKYVPSVKQIRLIDYFAGEIMIGLTDFYNMFIQSDIQKAVEKSYAMAKMMVEESKKYEDNA